jgi:hypothetical protein
MFRLSIDLEDEYPYVILGITSPAKDYRICWSLNKSLHLSLKRGDDIKVIPKSREPVFHPIFTYDDVNLQLKYRLVRNKRGQSIFLPEVREADYLLVIDENPELNMEMIQNQLRAIRQILLVFNVNISQLKQKQNLLLAA